MILSQKIALKIIQTPEYNDKKRATSVALLKLIILLFISLFLHYIQLWCHPMLPEI